MKGSILKLLKAQPEALSGEVISKELGISRVSIWKHIRKLQECGYQIDASPKGYRFCGDPDIPYPWEFDEGPATVHYFKVADSTMEIAREKARSGCPDFTVVVAGRQRSGRGRLDRPWSSEEGGLYFTMVLRPPVPPALSPRISFGASLVLVKVLRGMFGIQAEVKWPNDILVGDGKLSGMLSEMEADSDRLSYLNIGIGLNVNNAPSVEGQQTVSLAGLTGKRPIKKKILAHFLSKFSIFMEELPLDRVISEWKRYTSTLNRPVRVVTYNDTTVGIAEDVADDGTLVVRLDDGSTRKVVYGDCFYQNKQEFDV